MSDESFSPTGFSTVKIVLLVVATATLIVTAGLVLGIDDSSWNDDDGESTINGTGLASLETQEPRCGTHRSSNSTTAIHSADGGRRISINQTVPVAARDSELTADFRSVDDRRYLLDLQRTAGNRSTDCYLEMRFTATVNVSQRDNYTLIASVDDARIQRLVGEPGGSGVDSSTDDPRPPSMNDSEWQAALNASDDYFYNESRGHGSRSGEGGSGSSRTTGSGGDRVASITTKFGRGL